MSQADRVLKLIDEKLMCFYRFPTHDEIEKEAKIDRWQIGNVLTQLVRRGDLRRTWLDKPMPDGRRYVYERINRKGKQ